MPDEPTQHKRRWRFYRTSSGNAPAKEFLRSLPLADRVKIEAAMVDVEHDGLLAARHVRGDIYEVRASGATQSFRLLFAPEGQYNQVLLALEAFSKKTQKAPHGEIALAEARLSDWRSRARQP